MTNGERNRAPIGFEIRDLDDKGNSIDCATLEGLGEKLTREDVRNFANAHHDEDSNQVLVLIGDGCDIEETRVTDDIDAAIAWMNKRLKAVNAPR